MEKKLSYKKKFDILKDILKEEIFKRKPGEKLPGEYEIARVYGVNRGTVNKVLSLLEHEGLIERKAGVGSVVKETIERKLHYRIGVLIERKTGHVYRELTDLIIRKIQENQYFPIVIDAFPYEERPNEILTYLNEIIENSPSFLIVDGVGNFPFNFLKENEEKIRNLIFINKFETNIDFKATFILSDYEYGGYIGTKHLFEIGSEKIFIITQANPPYSPNIDQERIKGVKKAFKEACFKFKEEFIIRNRGENEENYLKNELLKRLKIEKKKIGIFVFADYVARKVQKILEEMGMWIGTDYSLCGYFNTPYSYEFQPPLTSISINEQGIAEKLDEILKEGKFPKEIFKIKPFLIERESTKWEKK